MKSRFTRQYVIRAMHRLLNPNASSSENECLYGMCYRLHGHDYKIQVSIEGEIDPGSGLLRFRNRLDDIVQRELIDRFDGTVLNETFQNTSGEALVHSFYEILRPHVPAELPLLIAIQETRKNYFERPQE